MLHSAASLFDTLKATDLMSVAHILAIGTELTLGQTVDTNSAWIARRLAALGIRCGLHLTVPDDLSPLVAALRRLCAEADLIVCTGGLGPTDDDLTRQAIAGVIGVPLEMDEASLLQLEQYFAQRKRSMPDRNRIQAMLPVGATALPNSRGTAPGILVRHGRSLIVSLPGVPGEMHAMWEQEIEPRLRSQTQGRTVMSRAVRTFGVPEAQVNDLLGELMQRGRNPEIGTSAAGGEVAVRINVDADSPAVARGLLDQAEQDVRARLGEAAYGIDDETLADAVGDLLKRSRTTLAVAESCTGGLLGKMLTDRAGSSAYFLGGVITYADKAKHDLVGVGADLLEQFGAVSEPVARAMAAGVKQRFGSDFALSITGIAGPGGATPQKPVGLVYIGVAARDTVTSREFLFGADQPREAIRERAARSALAMLRALLLKLAAG